MSESVAKVWVTVVLLFLFLMPFISFSLLHKLFRQYSFRLFVTVINRTALIYTAILCFMVLFILGRHPLIDDPEYPDPDEILAGGITIGFIFYFICIFLPALLIVNLMRKFSKDKQDTNATD